MIYRQSHLIIGQRDIKQIDYVENMRLQLCLNNCSLFFTIKNKTDLGKLYFSLINSRFRWAEVK